MVLMLSEFFIFLGISRYTVPLKVLESFYMCVHEADVELFLMVEKSRGERQRGCRVGECASPHQGGVEEGYARLRV